VCARVFVCLCVCMCIIEMSFQQALDGRVLIIDTIYRM